MYIINKALSIQDFHQCVGFELPDLLSAGGCAHSTVFPRDPAGKTATFPLDPAGDRSAISPAQK